MSPPMFLPQQPLLAGPSHLIEPRALRPPARFVGGSRHHSVYHRYNRSLLRVATHNVHGMTTQDGRKPASLDCLWSSLRADVILVQETHLNDATAPLLNLPRWICYWSHGGKSRRSSISSTAGVGILVRKRVLAQYGGHLHLQTESLAASRHGRLLHINANWMGHQLHLASIYLPNDATSQRDFIKRTLKPLSDSVLLARRPGIQDSNHEVRFRTSPTRQLVWGGDFNFASDVALDRITDNAPPLATHQDTVTSSIWSETLPSLRDSLRARHPTRRVFSHYHARGASRIDRVYVTTPLLPFCVKAVVVGRKEAAGASLTAASDHRPVLIELLRHNSQPLPPPTSATLRRRRPYRAPTDFLKDADFVATYREEVASLAAGAPVEPRALLEWWPSFKTQLKHLACRLNKEYRQIFAQRLAEADLRVHVLESRIALVGTAVHSSELGEARAHVRQLAARQLQIPQRHQGLLARKELPNRALTHRLKPPRDLGCGPALRRPCGRLATSPSECAAVAVQHYATISKSPHASMEARRQVLQALHSLPPPVVTASGDETVTEVEIAVALRNARPSSPGMDGLRVILYSKAKEVAAPLLARLFSAIGTMGHLPKNFHLGVIVPLHKKADKSVIANYRPITLLNTDYRLLAAILGSRLKPFLEATIDKGQTAFLPGRQIGENIQFLQMFPHVLAAERRAAFVAFCDFEKAYDTINRDFLFEVMQRMGVGDPFLRWTKLLLTDTKAVATVLGCISNPMIFEAGTRQGCPLSPLLYLFVGQALLTFLKAKQIGVCLPPAPDIPRLASPTAGPDELPVQPPEFWDDGDMPSFQALSSPELWAPPLDRGITIAAIQYADDINVLLSSTEQVSLFLQAMEVFGEASGQRLNTSKSKLLPVGSTEAPLGAEPGAHVEGLPVVASATTLGITFHAYTADADADFDSKIEKADRCLQRLAQCGLSAFGRGHASAAYCHSLLLHAAEFVDLPHAIADRMQRAVACLVDRDGRANGFAGVSADLLCGPPRLGGFGALPLQHHTLARRAKWALRLLSTGSTTPWARLAWTLLDAAGPSHSSRRDDTMLHHLRRVYLGEEWDAHAVISPSELAPPLRRLLEAAYTLPPLQRRIIAHTGEISRSADWMTVQAAFFARLCWSLRLWDTLMGCGAPVLPHAVKHRQLPCGTSIQGFSVKLGTHLLHYQHLIALREARYREFVAETGVNVQEPTWQDTTMQATLRALTVAPIDNTYKEPFWRCFLNGLPTAARLHIRQRCGCGASNTSPDRSHHFHHCRVARAVLDQIDASASDIAHLVASLRAVVPPAGVHKGTWAIVCLAAHFAMERGRRSLIHSRLSTESSQSPITQTLIATAEHTAVGAFWEVLEHAARSDIPPQWATARVATTQPFLRWNPDAELWTVHRGDV